MRRSLYAPGAASIAARLVSAVAAGAGLAALVAGCSSSGTPASTGSRATPSGTAVPACRSSDLKVTLGTSGAAAGSVYTPIDFTNTSSSACTLDGYPAVAMTTATTTGSQVGPAATRSATRPVTVVTLAPGATGNALLQVVDVLNYPAAQCDVASTSYLQVYPPGLTTPRYLPYPGKTCAKHEFVLGVAAVQAGRSGP